jgi:flagellar motor switch protein FliG
MKDPKRAAKAYGRFEKKSGNPDPKQKTKGEDGSFPRETEIRGFLKTGTEGNPFRKAAKLLLLLGKDQAAAILSHFEQVEIEKITLEIAGIKRIEKEEAKLLLESFGKAASGAVAVSGGVNVAKAMLNRAFGAEKGAKILGKVVPFGGEKPFAFLEDIEGQQIFMLLRKESSSVISIVLSFLSGKKAGEIIKMLSPVMQVETVRRLGRMKDVSPSVVASIEGKVRERLHAQGRQVTEEIDGQSALANILKQMDFREGERIIESLDDPGSSLKKEIAKRLFTGEDLLRIGDRDMQRILRDFEDREIALLLKGSTSAIEEKLVSNVSDRRKELIRSEREMLGQLRRSEIDRSRQDFLEYVRKLIERGEVVLADGENPLI